MLSRDDADEHGVTDTNFASDANRPVSNHLGMFYMNGSENFDINGFRILSSNLPPTPKVPTFVLTITWLATVLSSLDLGNSGAA